MRSLPWFVLAMVVVSVLVSRASFGWSWAATTGLCAILISPIAWVLIYVQGQPRSLAMAFVAGFVSGTCSQWVPGFVASLRPELWSAFGPLSGGSGSDHPGGFFADVGGILGVFMLGLLDGIAGALFGFVLSFLDRVNRLQPPDNLPRGK